jgi:hypothetical protein
MICYIVYSPLKTPITLAPSGSLEREFNAECLLKSLLLSYLCRNSTPGRWNSSGVTTEQLDDTHILCVSSHLTSFSVLVSVESAVVKTCDNFTC